jgi:hypothetical protein
VVCDIPGFSMISKIDSHQSTPKARGSCVFIKSSLLNDSPSNYINFNEDSAKKVAVMQFMDSNGLFSPLPSDVKSTKKEGTFIDNIFTNQESVSSGRYLSFTSFHEPLWIKF